MFYFDTENNWQRSSTVKQFSFSILLILYRRAGTNPSLHWARGRLHPGLDASQKNRAETQPLTLTFTPTAIILSWISISTCKSEDQTIVMLQHITSAANELKEMESPAEVDHIDLNLCHDMTWRLMSRARLSFIVFMVVTSTCTLSTNGQNKIRQDRAWSALILQVKSINLPGGLIKLKENFLPSGDYQPVHLVESVIHCVEQVRKP